MFGVVNSQCHSQYIFNSAQIHKKIRYFNWRNAIVRLSRQIIFLDDAVRAFNLRIVGHGSVYGSVEVFIAEERHNETLN